MSLDPKDLPVRCRFLIYNETWAELCKDLVNAQNTGWVLFCAALIFFMQGPRSHENPGCSQRGS
jgi:hypothetical protein